jgi:hypothetical protein
MRKPSRPRRPSPALIVALVALVAALGGTALAGPSLHEAKKKKKKQAGDKIIKKRSLSGNRLKAKTVTGAELDLAKLGTVPSATNATHAATAGTAGNADSVGGKRPSDFVPAGRVVAGTTKLAAGLAPEGNGATVLQRGPFTLKLRCVDNEDGSFQAILALASTEPGSTGKVGSGDGAPFGGDTELTLVNSAASAPVVDGGFQWWAIAPSGAAVQGMVLVGWKSQGADCLAHADGIG